MRIRRKGGRTRVVEAAYERERHRMDPARAAQHDADRVAERFHAGIRHV